MSRLPGDPAQQAPVDVDDEAAALPPLRSLLVFDRALDLESLGALDEGDARFQAPLPAHGARGFRGGTVEGWLLRDGAAAVLRAGQAVVTLLLGPFEPGGGAEPLAALGEGRTSPLHTFGVAGARLRVSLRSVDDTPGRRRYVRRRALDPALRGRRCGPRTDDDPERAVLADAGAPEVQLVLFVPAEERLLLAQASLEPAPQ